MRKSRILYIFVSLALMLFTTSQNIFADEVRITSDSHYLVYGDYIERLSVEGLNIGCAGHNVTWDFSNIEIVADTFPQHYVISDNGFRCKERGMTSSYRIDNDSLMLYAYSSNLENLVFELPQLTMIYPFSYGDSVCAPFSAKGKYCGKYAMSIDGSRQIKVDAYGKIFLANDMILKDVLRLHTTTTQNILLDGKEISGTNKAKSKQEITEEYSWYIADYRYPIFEYTISSTFHEGKLVATKNYTLCNFPSTISEQLYNRKDITDGYMEEGNNDDILPIAYEMTQTGNHIKVRYTTSADIDILFIIANTNGILCRQEQARGLTGKYTEISFDCTGYRPGSYIMYINVGGKVLSETFYIK